MLTSKQRTLRLSSQTSLQAPRGFRRCFYSHRIAAALNASREGCAETRPNDGSGSVLHRLGTSGLSPDRWLCLRGRPLLRLSRPPSPNGSSC